MLQTKWFQKSVHPITGINANERFAERLDYAWFKKPLGGAIRLGQLLSQLIDRVTKLEEAVKPKDTIRIPTIEEGLQTGRYNSDDVARFRTHRSDAVYYGTKFIQAVGEKPSYPVIELDMEAAVIEAGKRLRFERKERNGDV